jgi:hypothetical protein
VFLLQSTTYGFELYTPTLSPGTPTTRLINCLPFVETIVTGCVISALSLEAAVTARPIFELAIALSNDDGGLKKTTSPTLGGKIERVTSTTCYVVNELTVST